MNNLTNFPSDNILNSNSSLTDFFRYLKGMPIPTLNVKDYPAYNSAQVFNNTLDTSNPLFDVMLNSLKK